MRRHRLKLERLALDFYIERTLVGAPQAQHDLAAGGATQLLFGLTQCEIVSRLLVDRKNQVPRLDSGLRRGRSILRRDYLQLPVLDRDNKAEAGLVVVRRLLQCPEGLFVEEGGVRIQAR